MLITNVMRVINLEVISKKFILQWNIHSVFFNYMGLFPGNMHQIQDITGLNFS